MPRVPRQVVLGVKIALLAGVLGFVGWAFWRELRQLDVATLRLRPGFLLLSVAAGFGVFVVMAAGYRVLLRRTFGHAIPPGTMAAAAWVPQLGKYVPGKVAAVAAAVGLLRRAGVPGAVGLACYVILDGSTVTTGLCLSAPLLLTDAARERLPGAPLGAAAVVALGLVLLSPPVFGRLVGLGLRLTGREPLGRALRWSDYAVPVASALVQWSLCGTVLWAMTSAVAPAPLPAAAILSCVSVAALAITISYLAVFAPGGVGVREGIYALGLAAYGVPGEVAAVVAILLRVQSILVEVTLAAAGLWLMRGATPAVPSTACPSQTTASSAGSADRSDTSAAQ